MGHYLKLAHFRKNPKRWLVKYQYLKDHWGKVDFEKSTISLDTTEKHTPFELLCTLLHEVDHVASDFLEEDVIEHQEKNRTAALAYFFRHHYDELIDYLEEIRNDPKEKAKLDRVLRRST